MSKRRKDWRARVTPLMLQERALFNAKLRDAVAKAIEAAFERAMFACYMRAASQLNSPAGGDVPPEAQP